MDYTYQDFVSANLRFHPLFTTTRLLGSYFTSFGVVFGCEEPDPYFTFEGVGFGFARLLLY